MSFDEEYIDPHDECAHEIARLKAEVATLHSRLKQARGEVIEECCKVLEHMTSNTGNWREITTLAYAMQQLRSLASLSGEARNG